MQVDLGIGSELAGYRIEALLGRGGMGVAYLAEDLRLKRKVALKLLSASLAADESFRERFLHESELAASIDHPNIVPIYEAGELDELLFIAMRYVEGRDLKERLREGPLAPEQTVGLLVQIARALDAAHALGLVHRDVKPSNVLIAPGAGHDGADHVYLADFGLTKRLAESGAVADDGQLMGTIDYVAPEQIEGGNVDGRADVYSLGCLLYECLTGLPPFRGDSDIAVLFAHLEVDPPLVTEQRPELPEAIDCVVATALAKSPDERYATCRELVGAARQSLGIVEPARARWLHAPLLIALLGLAILAAGLASYFAVRGDGGATPAAPTGRLLQIDPETNAVVESTPIGELPSAVAMGAGHVWVTDLGEDTLWRIDPATGHAVQAPTNGPPVDVAVGGSLAFVADSGVTRFDTASVVADGTVETGGATAVASGEGKVWIAQGDGMSASRLSTTLGAVAAVVPIPIEERGELERQVLSDIAVGEGAIWLLGDPLEHRVWHVDPDVGAVVASISLPSAPGSVAAGAGAVWVTGLLDDVVWRIDPETNEIVATIEVGRGATGVAAGAGDVWVANSIDGTVMRIDPEANKVVATVSVAEAPVEVAVGEGVVWVAAVESAGEGEDEAAIEIGVLSDCAGPFAPSYDAAVAGAELALIQRGGRLAGPELTDGVVGVSVGGQPVRLTFGCAAWTSPSALLEARRLVERVGVDVLVGPLEGVQGIALRDYAKRHPEVTFVNGTAAAPSATLREPAPNFFRFSTDAAQWVAGLGSHAYNDLGWRRAAVIEYDDVFPWVQTAGFIAEFCSLGGEIAKRVSLPNFGTDYSSAIAEIPADIDGVFAAVPPISFYALASSNHPVFQGEAADRIVGGTEATLFPPEDDEVGDRLLGVAVAGDGPPRSSREPAWTRFVKDFREAFPDLIAAQRAGGTFQTAETGIFAIDYYNGMEAVLRALEIVEGDLSDGQRGFQAALAELVLDAPNGRFRLDANRQAIGPNYLHRLEKDEQGNFVFRTFRVVENVEQTFNGYFTPDSPPPGPSEPGCVHGNPPPWTRQG